MLIGVLQVPALGPALHHHTRGDLQRVRPSTAQDQPSDTEVLTSGGKLRPESDRREHRFERNNALGT